MVNSEIVMGVDNNVIAMSCIGRFTQIKWLYEAQPEKMCLTEKMCVLCMNYYKNQHDFQVSLASLAN